MIWYLGLSTALWFVITYLAFKVGHDRGYASGKQRQKDLHELQIKNALIFGEQKAWREISQWINGDLTDLHSGTVN